MKVKVVTEVGLSQEQRQTLQNLGCEAIPFIIWPHALFFAATCSPVQEEELRGLPYVNEIEPMLKFGPA